MSAAHLGFRRKPLLFSLVMAVGRCLSTFMHRHHYKTDLAESLGGNGPFLRSLMAMAFAGFCTIHHGAEMASLFLTGYALEEVLSVDNLFVTMAIFAWFRCRISTVCVYTGAALGDCLPRHLCGYRHPAC